MFNWFLQAFLSWLAVCLFVVPLSVGAVVEGKRPNVLFVITDDQSWAHAGAYGDRGVKTPAFDRIAKEGVLFEHAFCAAPSCTPSRNAILTGQAIWRLAEGGLLLSTLPDKYAVFPELLANAGYETAYTGKSWGPGNWRAGGRLKHPVGKAYQTHKLKRPRPGMSNIDYAANFEAFLNERDEAKPFMFWYGSSEPHLGYAKGQGLKAGKKLQDAHLFDCFPDNDTFRSEVLDYYVEIEHADSHLERIVALLEERGELEDTLIIATGDHGIPLGRSKCNLYDSGTRVPLAIRFPSRFPGQRTVSDFVSLTDLAPTILEFVGLPIPKEMTGRSLVGLLTSGREGRIESLRDRVITAFERHTWCRPEGVGYPMRALRTDQFLYIRNYEPSRWPAGDPTYQAKPQGPFGDIDRSITKSFLMANKDHPDVTFYFELAMGKRPPEELYDISTDPGQIHNLARDAHYLEIKNLLASELEQYLLNTGDPRQSGVTPWDEYLYTGAKAEE